MKPPMPPICLEPKTKEKIASEMNISLRTLQRRIKKAGLDVPRGFIPPDVQDAIYQALGWKRLSQNGTNWQKVSWSDTNNMESISGTLRQKICLHEIPLCFCAFHFLLAVCPCTKRICAALPSAVSGTDTVGDRFSFCSNTNRGGWWSNSRDKFSISRKSATNVERGADSSNTSGTLSWKPIYRTRGKWTCYLQWFCGLHRVWHTQN